MVYMKSSRRISELLEGDPRYEDLLREINLLYDGTTALYSSGAISL